MTTQMNAVAVVVIGRNEGERLRRCLACLSGIGIQMIYVDSGSSDGSVALARSAGFEVLELDASLPFTAARARNAGLEGLLRLNRHLEFIQFLDGDCEMIAGWLDAGVEALRGRDDIAVACGRLHEKHPEASVFARLCDIEWGLTVGEVEACGGNMMVRVAAFRKVGGFDPTVIAAEDTEFCSRLRLNGWRIVHISADMARHDSAILRVGQWWRRCMRAGYGFGQFSGTGGVRGFFRRRALSSCFWAFLMPALASVLTWLHPGLALGLLAGYIVLAYRVYRGVRRRGVTQADSVAYAAHCVLAKVPQFIGMMKYTYDRLKGRQGSIIEHKEAAQARV